MSLKCKIFERVQGWQEDYFSRVSINPIGAKMASYGLCLARLDWVTMGQL
jgi:hypothetical protein